jgi:hypothetical protein
VRGSALRWFEAGVSAEYRLWVARSFRIAVGGQAAFSSLLVSDAASVDARPYQQASWSARAGGLVSLEARVDAPIWLGLGFEPAAVLRPVHYTLGAGAAPAVVEGASLGFVLTAHFEHVRLPER